MTREERNNAIKILRNFDLNSPKVNSVLFSAEEITNAFDMAIKALEQESCEDCISRQAALDIHDDYNVAVENGELEAYRKHRQRLLKLPPVQPKTGHCKDCKYFEYDHFENMGGIPLITAHKVCKRHGLICKTDEDGYCHLWEHKAESEG